MTRVLSLKTYILLILMLGAPICAGAANSSTTSLANPFIYELSINGKTSYLFGSRHYGFGTGDLPAWVLDLQKQSEVHFYEIDMSEQSDFDALVTIYQQPEVYYSFTVKKNSEQMQTLLVWNGISPQLAPYLPTKSCDDFYLKKKYLFDNKFKSLDTELQLNTKRDRKILLTLDTEELRAQADKLVTYVASAQGCSLNDMLFNMQLSFMLSEREVLDNQNLERYQSGDERFFQNTSTDSPDVFYRNHAWVQKLSPVLKTKSSFIVVGVGHLFGEEGLLKLLQQQGFTVTRKTSAPTQSTLKAFR